MGAQTEWSRGLGLCRRAAMAMGTWMHFWPCGSKLQSLLGLRIFFLRP